MSVSDNASNQVNGTGDGWVELYRTNHVGIDRTLPVTLMIDNTSAGSVLPYERLEVEVPTGPHKLRAKSEEGSSKELTIVVEYGQRVELTVTSWPGIARLNPLFLGKYATRLRLRIVKRR